MNVAIGMNIKAFFTQNAEILRIFFSMKELKVPLLLLEIVSFVLSESKGADILGRYDFYNLY